MASDLPQPWLLTDNLTVFAAGVPERSEQLVVSVTNRYDMLCPPGKSLSKVVAPVCKQFHLGHLQTHFCSDMVQCSPVTQAADLQS